METPPLPNCLSKIKEAQAIPFHPGEEGRIQLRFSAPAGLYQFSVIADAREFNWEELYYPFHLCGNKGQRTGPWDFNSRDENKPLVPSYWVFLNGRRIGLWFFQRVSVDDIEHRRFRGRMAFHLPSSGEALLELLPYRPFTIHWMSSVLEADPEDILAPLPFAAADAPRKCPAAAWSQPSYWNALRESLSTTHAIYAEPLRAAFDWICAQEGQPPNFLPLLLAAYRLEGRPEALKLALRMIDDTIAAPHWGNPREDGFGHDGDMRGGHAMRALAWAYHGLGPELREERTKALLDKLRHQGTRFFELELLSRDYWGGSVLQGHGWESIFAFGSAVLHLLGVLPEAELWASYILPRAERAMKAAPRDGVVPPSCFGHLYLYLDSLTLYRDTLAACGGGDVFDHGAVHKVIDYMIAVLHEKERVMIGCGVQASPFIGANHFFNRVASRFGDRRAAGLQRSLLSPPRKTFFHGFQETAYFLDTLWGFLSYDPAVAAPDRLPAPPKLSFFEDSGMAHYRDDAKGITLSLRCGPWCGYNAYRRAQGPCDRMSLTPDAGHFILSLGVAPRLVTPAYVSYRLRSFLRSCLLIDDQGQYGDIGYPMSLPSLPHRGEEIETVQWDEANETGRIRLKLGPAYPDSLGVVSYTREFLIGKEKLIICRDQVVRDRPRHFSWLFQSERRIGVTLEENLSARFGGEPALHLRPQSAALELKASIAETDIVWAYADPDGFTPFDHVRYDSTAPAATALVDFVFRW